MKLTLTDKKQEIPDVTSFIFKAASPITWQAGQFLEYFLPHENMDERGDERHFTIASAPHEQNIWLTTRWAGEKSSSFKKTLFSLQAGQTVEIEGPRGNFVVADPRQDMVFIAGGIGITPFRSILLDLAKRGEPINVTLLYANRTAGFIYQDELEKLQNSHPNFQIHYFVDPQRIDEAAIRKYVPDLPAGRQVFYVSGPEVMVKSFEQILSQMGVSSENIKRDYFPGYTAL